jgi:CRP-like cAMP-binding protein
LHKLESAERLFISTQRAGISQEAESVFYIQSGRIRLSMVAKNGKEATVALLGVGDFAGKNASPWLKLCA